jgi:hypothetical protein
MSTAVSPPRGEAASTPLPRCTSCRKRSYMYNPAVECDLRSTLFLSGGAILRCWVRMVLARRIPGDGLRILVFFWLILGAGGRQLSKDVLGLGPSSACRRLVYLQWEQQYRESIWYDERGSYTNRATDVLWKSQEAYIGSLLKNPVSPAVHLFKSQGIMKRDIHPDQNDQAADPSMDPSIIDPVRSKYRHRR